MDLMGIIFFFYLFDYLEEFAMYFNYVKKLDFYEEPDYKMLKMLFNSVYVQNKFPEDNLYDWSTI